VSICTVEGLLLMMVTSCALEGVPTLVPGKKTLSGLGVNVVPAAIAGAVPKPASRKSVASAIVTSADRLDRLSPRITVSSPIPNACEMLTRNASLPELTFFNRFPPSRGRPPGTRDPRFSPKQHSSGSFMITISMVANFRLSRTSSTRNGFSRCKHQQVTCPRNSV
jgi:hypothetical protein